jgi:hypothetical protein
MLSTECVNDWCPDCRLANCLCTCHTDDALLRPDCRDPRESWRRVIFLPPPANLT